MFKIVTFEELIQIERHFRSKTHAHHDLRCFFCCKTFKAKDMLYVLYILGDVFKFRACSEECTNLFLLNNIQDIANV